MLTEAEIQRALHAARVVPLEVANPHGRLGLEQLAATVARLRGEGPPRRVRRPIALSVETWEKLNHLARATAPAGRQPPSASEMAAAVLEQLVAEGKSQPPSPQ